jgi:hypothetical protein
VQVLEGAEFKLGRNAFCLQNSSSFLQMRRAFSFGVPAAAFFALSVMRAS